MSSAGRNSRTIMLLANYLPDGQESMQRFANLLANELPRRGVPAELIRPEPFLGRMIRGGASLAKWIGYIDKLLIFPNRLRKRLGSFGPSDILHICDHSSAVYTRTASRIPHLVTVHDLLAIRSALGEIPENPTGRSGRIYQRMIRAGLNRARRTVCVSRATQDDLLRLTSLQPSQSAVVHNGLNYPYRPMAQSEAKARIERKLGRSLEPFIVHVGGNQWYKNRRGVLGIWAELARIDPNFPSLILVGKRLPPPLLREIEEQPNHRRIATIHDADNEDLRALYSMAEALLFPSLMEGFGWPIIEAQACGCRVATSNREPMRESGGEAAAYFDPRDWPSAANTLQSLLREGHDARAARVQMGLRNAANFSAEKMIDSYAQQYDILTAQ